VVDDQKVDRSTESQRANPEQKTPGQSEENAQDPDENKGEEKEQAEHIGCQSHLGIGDRR